MQTTHKLVSIVFTLNGIWTLDFFYFVSLPLCVSEHMKVIYIAFLDTIGTLYPFSLLLLTYVGIELHAELTVSNLLSIWGVLFIDHLSSSGGLGTVIQAFATLFLLSYAKLIALMYEALFITVVINDESKVLLKVSYIDPAVFIFSHKHRYLILLSTFVLVFIVLPPLLLLIAFPTRLLQKISRCVSVQTFVDPFHSCYNDAQRELQTTEQYQDTSWQYWHSLQQCTSLQEQ